MDNKAYKSRVCDEYLQLKLRTSGAVLVTGPKWCGKTWTAAHAAKSVLYLQDPDRKASYLKMAQTQPSLLLRGNQPRLIDEWQDAKVLWDAVRFSVDQNPGMGQFILTGSVSVDEYEDNEDDKEAKKKKDESEKVMHTGTGRISRLRMRPMSLFETGESNGTISLKSLFDGNQEVASMSQTTVEDLAHIICRGGWPASLNLNKEDSLEVAKNYVEAVCERDARAIDHTRKDPDRVRAILRSLARNISTMATSRTIMGDVVANDVSLTNKTLDVYLRALRKLFVVEDIKAWQPSLRSKTAIRTSDKRQFVDPSIAVAALGIGPKAILDDFNYFGFLFESLATRDLRVYTEPLRGQVRHYHDANNLEADLIILLSDGRWAPVEVKLGSKEIEEGASHLISLANDIDMTKFRAPSFLMVLTGGEFAYRREDGVFVVPLGCLRD